MYKVKGQCRIFLNYDHEKIIYNVTTQSIGRLKYYLNFRRKIVITFKNINEKCVQFPLDLLPSID